MRRGTCSWCAPHLLAQVGAPEGKEHVRAFSVLGPRPTSGGVLNLLPAPGLSSAAQAGPAGSELAPAPARSAAAERRTLPVPAPPRAGSRAESRAHRHSAVV